MISLTQTEFTYPRVSYKICFQQSQTSKLPQTWFLSVPRQFSLPNSIFNNNRVQPAPNPLCKLCRVDTLRMYTSRPHLHTLLRVRPLNREGNRACRFNGLTQASFSSLTWFSFHSLSLPFQRPPYYSTPN